MGEKDFNLKITVRNARLLRAVENAFGSGAELSRVAGISQSDVSALMTMRASPFNKSTGELTKAAEAIVSALGIPAGELWPDHIARLKAKKATVEIEMDAETFAAIAENDPEKTAIYRDAIDKWSSGLNKREVYVISQHQGGATYREIGKDLGVSGGRVMEIERKAMRKMRGRAMRDKVRSFTEITE